ncbi:MAG: hypothetical protein JW791_05280 [Nanoarchaeota archaeon]|nr:hypothetical protein [Nanoarchaeota archaeon]
MKWFKKQTLDSLIKKAGKEVNPVTKEEMNTVIILMRRRMNITGNPRPFIEYFYNAYCLVQDFVNSKRAECVSADTNKYNLYLKKCNELETNKSFMSMRPKDFTQDFEYEINRLIYEHGKEINISQPVTRGLIVEMYHILTDCEFADPTPEDKLLVNGNTNGNIFS